MRMSILILIFSTIGLCSILSAQDMEPKKLGEVSSSVSKNYDKGVAAIRNMDFKNAEKFLLKVIQKEPGLIDGNREIGLLYYRQKQYRDALRYLEFAATHDPNWNNSLRYTLASTYWSLDEFEQCEITIKDLFSRPISGEKLKKEAAKMLSDAGYSARMKDTTRVVYIEKLSNTINSEWPEYLPVITADGQSLVFTRRNRGKEDFYISQLDTAGNWGYARTISELNTSGNEGAMCLSADGKTMIFTICDDPRGYGSCDLYQSEKVRGRWSPPRNLGYTINSKHKETQAALSPDGRRLYFVSDRPGGLGDHDIWYSDMDPKGDWLAPINAGETINTPYDELTPMIHFDGQTMYFASAGHPGLGGLDLFRSSKDPQSVWGPPVNLGYPINTKLDESCLAVHIDGTNAYLSKEGKDDSGNLTMNIHHLVLPENVRATKSSYVRVQVQDENTSAPLRTLIEIISLDDNKRSGLYQTDRAGETLICLMDGYKYAVNVYHPDYLFYSEHFNMEENIEAYHEQLLPIKLAPNPPNNQDSILTEETVVLKNVFFDTGSSELADNSSYELTKLAQWLKSNEAYRIEISGHTDNVGNPTSNQKLSEERALAVVEYLIKQGIEPSRLQHRGYGDTQPITSNDTEAGRQLNRRTAFKIIR